MNKDALDIIGQTTTPLEIGESWQGTHKFYVANGISYPVILGTDLLSQLGAVTYNFKDCTLHVNDGQGIPMGDYSGCTVKVCSSIEVPPLTKMAVVAEISKPIKDNKECIFIGY